MIARLRPKLAQVPGASLFLQAVQDIRVGGRQSNAQYQFTLQADSLPDLNTWVPKLIEALQQDRRSSPTSIPTSSSAACRSISRSTATRRRGSAVDARRSTTTLYDAFGQRQVSTIYKR